MSALTVSAPRARRFLGAGATAAVVGILLCLSDAPGIGGIIAILGIVATMWGLHGFGRSGEDAPRRGRTRRRKRRRPSRV